MTGITAQPISGSRAVRWWLLAVAALIALMVLVGGATRLTESGLSIVEWKPVTGALPPLTEAQWAQAFEGYKAIPQYRELNAGMSLAEFKTIFWWEWSHRLLGRVIGIVYLLPFLWFLWRGGAFADLPANLLWCAGCGPACGPGLQYLAGDRRRANSVNRAAVLRRAVVAQPVRQHADCAVRTPHDGVCAARAGAAACDRRG